MYLEKIDIFLTAHTTQDGLIKLTGLSTLFLVDSESFEKKVSKRK